MKNTILKTILASFLIGLVVTGCKEDNPAPNVNFYTANGYTYGDKSAYAGDTVLVGIHCIWNGSDPITTLTIYVDDVMSGSPYDIPQGYQQEFLFDARITKSLSASEKWEFEATDTQGKKSSVSLTLTLVNSIFKIAGVAINAQSNQAGNNFYSLGLNKTYISVAYAQLEQKSVDLLGYYDDTDKFQLLSPSVSPLPEPYATGMANWTTKNKTLFYKTSLTTAQFDAINDYSSIYNAFSENNATNKAKNLTVNDIYAFRTANDGYGLFKVIGVNNAIDGYVNIQILTKP